MRVVGADRDPVLGLREGPPRTTRSRRRGGRASRTASPGENFPAQRGAPLRTCSASDLPSIWIPPSGKSQSSAPRYQSLRASVFWNRVGFGSFDTAISARLLCRM